MRSLVYHVFLILIHVCVCVRARARVCVRMFITEIYVALLQGYCSDALPILGQLKRSFQARVECVGKNPWSNRCPFYTAGPTSGNAWAWLVEVRAKLKRTTPFPLSEGNCDLWRLGGINGIEKISEVGRSKTQQTPPYPGKI